MPKNYEVIKTLGKPYKGIKKVLKSKVVKQAWLEDIDTGRKKITEVIDENGKTTKEHKPIMERVYREAIKENVEVEVEVWCVTDNDEIHEFSTKEDAENFYKGA